MSGVRIPPHDYEVLELAVHGLLAGVPLCDVSRIELPGGGPDRGIEDVRRLMRSTGKSGNRAVRFLFALRGAMGKAFGWDRNAHEHPEESYARRIPADVLDRSSVTPGTREGPFRLLYVLPRELLGEVRNATVHAFSCMCLEPWKDGYRLYWAVYVQPVSRLTGLYMALIEPFRRFVVYPATLRRLQDAWRKAYGDSGPR